MPRPPALLTGEKKEKETAEVLHIFICYTHTYIYVLYGFFGG
jgi:hypothetical protein